jgi:hypothetical protein
MNSRLVDAVEFAVDREGESAAAAIAYDLVDALGEIPAHGLL